MNPRAERAALAMLLVGAWVLRASPFFRPTGVLGWPVDYDEGVYLSAAAALFHGSLPWRDFAFLHPPGYLLLLGPLASLFEPPAALTAARWLSTLIGTANVALVYAVVRRRGTAAGALVGAALYAAWPEVVVNERRALLEPVLNLAGLGGLFLAAAGRRSAAVVLAAALCIKSWAVTWLVGVFASGARQISLIAGLLAAAFIAAFALSAPMSALTELVLVHLGRPPDGDLERWVRLREMFWARSAVPLLLLLVTGPALFRARAWPEVRALATALALLVAAFLSASAWWNQYDCALAAMMAPLCGLGFSLAFPKVGSIRGLAIALALAAPALKAVLDVRHDESPDQRALATQTRALSLHAAHVCAFEPADALLAGHWPAPPLDSYGQQLVDARQGGRYASAAEAFASDSSQAGLRAQLESCDLVVRGWRGQWQMNATTRAWFEGTFAPAQPEVWLRRTPQP